MTKPLRGLFVSWAKLRRADTIAEHLGIRSCTVEYFYRGTPFLLTLLKYALQTGHTLILLLRRRPLFVFVTNPPVFAIIPVYLYCTLFRARLLIDFHSGCLLEARWRRWLWMQKFFARRALLNLVHNDDNARDFESWGVPYLVFPSLPPEITVAAKAETRERPTAVYICSFKNDEPVDTFLAAARTIPDVDFHVTGRAPDGVRATLSSNVKLTGFLPENDYNELLGSADIIIALTTRPGTLLYGAQEAISLGKPLVLSRTPTLESYFAGGTIFVENTVQDLGTGIRDALAREEELAKRMTAFAERCRDEGEVRLRKLREILS